MNPNETKTETTQPETQPEAMKKRGRKAEQFIKLTIADLLNVNKAITTIDTVSHLELIDNTQKVARTREQLMEFLAQQEDSYVVQPDDRFMVEGTSVNFGDLLVNGKPNPKVDKGQVVEISLNKLVKVASANFEDMLRTKLTELAQTA